MPSLALSNSSHILSFSAEVLLWNIDSSNSAAIDLALLYSIPSTPRAFLTSITPACWPRAARIICLLSQPMDFRTGLPRIRHGLGYKSTFKLTFRSSKLVSCRSFRYMIATTCFSPCITLSSVVSLYTSGGWKLITCVYGCIALICSKKFTGTMLVSVPWSAISLALNALSQNDTSKNAFSINCAVAKFL